MASGASDRDRGIEPGIDRGGDDPPDPQAADREGESPRQRSRRLRREAGDRSAAAARALLELTDAAVARLGLDEELLEVVLQARAIPSHGARRREERRLAGVLRGIDLPALEQLLERQRGEGGADARQFQRAEAWRARLVEEGEGALGALFAELGGEQDRSRWVGLIEDARRERSHGKPRGAARRLFRQVAAALRAG